jgi:vacuolar protein-sorting-associated protein 4
LGFSPFWPDDAQCRPPKTGSTPHNHAASGDRANPARGEIDFEELGRRSDGYSGADIGVLVRDAIMVPIRKVQQATHFKQVGFFVEACYFFLFLCSWRFCLFVCLFGLVWFGFGFVFVFVFFPLDQVDVTRGDPPVLVKGAWMPCSPGDYGAVEKTWMNIDPQQLAEPNVDMVRGF